MSVAVTLFVVLSAQLPRLQIDTSIESFLRDDDPSILRYDAFRDEFGHDELITIAIQPHEVFDVIFLEKLQNLHARLETEVPYIDRVYSLINARSIEADADELVVDELLEVLPATPAAMESLMAKVMRSPLYRGALISEAGDVTSLLLRLRSSYQADDGNWHNLGEQQLQEVATAVQQLLFESDVDLGIVHVVGSPILTAELTIAMFENTALFTALTLLLVIILLAFMYRRLSGVLLPLLVVLATIPSTFGVLVLFEQPFQTPLATVPSFILAVAICASVHILSVFYLALDRGLDKKSAIEYAMSHSGLAVLFTSLTTAAGLCSFLGAELRTVANFGLTSAVGAMLSFFFSVSLLPALLALCPISSRPVMTKEAVPWVRKLTHWCAELSIRHYRSIVLMALAMIAISLLMATRVHFGNDLKAWFPADHRMNVSTEFVESAFTGSMQVEVVIDTGDVDGIKEPEFLQRVSTLQQWLQDYSSGDLVTGKVSSIVDLLSETNQALGNGDLSEYKLADSREMIAQELLLLELSGTDDLFEMVDEDYQIVRLSVNVPLLDAVDYGIFIRQLEEKLGQDFVQAIQVDVTGMTPVIARTAETVVSTTARSYLLAACLITVMMIFLLGGLKIGLLSMLPNLLPVIVVVGLMALFGAPLDTYSLPIGAIALGLAVDDTIHFMHNFKRYFDGGGNVDHAIRMTLDSAGRALTVTTVVMAVAFFVYTFASMVNIVQFGLFTGLCVLLAYFSDLIFAPALMKWVFDR